MNEALCSILSMEDRWSFDLEGRFIKFNKDGTGEKLWCRCNFNVWIAAEFEWRSVEPPRDPSRSTEVPSQVASGAPGKGPQPLGQLNLEITLTKRLPETVKHSILSKSTMVNEKSLTDEAFYPKLYTVRIEKGNFVEPCYIGYPSSDKPRFALRLLFDKSPYPPRSGWKRPEEGPDGGQFWDHVEFVGRISPELVKKGAVMNNISTGWWGGCVVS
ncbi:hypothetical protein GL218_09007 [Daldinia childiae]|uniref:uncharacterized protein n=1 Tax=Daldinia childiae TaxID=326645 RepID=UPI00144717AC|nr:uncharacterized protein GL218_09007 [Daldinia childiae]KAF3066461.1 hypothetical protein GL218_09007 [Daldinia childiae]